MIIIKNAVKNIIFFIIFLFLKQLYKMYYLSYILSFIFNIEEEEKPTMTPHSMSPIPKGRFYNEVIGKHRKNIILYFICKFF